MNKIAIVLVLILGGIGIAAPPKVAPSKRFAIGVAAPARALRGASSPITSTGLQVARSSVTVSSDGTATLMITYVNAANNPVVVRQINIDAGCGKITDNMGNQLAATTPPALCTAINTFGAQLDTVIGNAAAGGKLNL